MRGSNEVCWKSETSFTVVCMESIASSIAEISPVMSERSKGVMKERRTASITCRVISSASFSSLTISRP